MPIGFDAEINFDFPYFFYDSITRNRFVTSKYDGRVWNINWVPADSESQTFFSPGVRPIL